MLCTVVLPIRTSIRLSITLTETRYIALGLSRKSILL
jgi:hypothetical protein